MINNKIVIQIDEGLESFVPGYLKDIEKWTEIIINSVEKKDFDTIRKLSHKMIGTGSGYGFDLISRTGHIINNAAHTEDIDAIKKSCENLCDYLKKIEVEYIEEEDFDWDEDD